MTDFVTFAKLHGILIDSPPPIGYWRRYPTEDHPRKRNGAVKYMGDFGLVQNWAVDSETAIWKSDQPNNTNVINVAKLAREAEQRRREQQREATNKAAWILGQCQDAKHDYLKAKGFDDEYGKVWLKDGEQILVIPMRIDGHLVGCQLINQDGGKKFLFGQRTSGATFVFDNKGFNIVCEGYATALSIRKCLKSFKTRYKLHVCFSAGNMIKVARELGNGVVVADNDSSLTGEKAAKEIGWKYWMSDKLGEDFNDTHQRLGTFKAGSSLLKSLGI
jgi:putative DNA primase/helicase